MKTKLKLRGWVKVVLIAIGLVSLAWVSTIQQEKAVARCVDAGHTYQYCVEGLK